VKLWLQRDGRALDFEGAVPFGKGGEAAVFAVPTTIWAAKVYHQYVPGRGDKLRVMIDHPPEDPTAAQGHVSIAWPQDLLVDAQGRTVGYVMPLVKSMRRLIDFYHPATRRRECPLFSYYYLTITAQNLATAVLALHRRGYVLGDVNESNILAAETAMVTLVDTDSFQVREAGSGKVHYCIVGTPLFTPREMQGVNFATVERREEQDLFGLGVLLFQLLMEGTHPFQVRFTGAGEPPEPAAVIRDGRFSHAAGSAMWQPPPLAPPFGMLDARLRALFTRCFVNGHHDPRERPTADEWRTNLAAAAAELVTCKKNPSHRHWPHVKKCPWCERAAKLKGRDPFPDPAQVKAGQHLTTAAVPARGKSSNRQPSTASAAAPSKPVTRPQAVSAAVLPGGKRRRKKLVTALLATVGTVGIGLLGFFGLPVVLRSIHRSPAPLQAASLAAGEVGRALSFNLGGGQALRVRFVPGGTFTMGSPPSEPYRLPTRPNTSCP